MKLNLGCGGQSDDGWLGIDLDGTADLLHDLRNGIPYDDGTVEYAVAHHLLDRLYPYEVADLLAECHRVIIPGGVLRISLADVAAAMHAADFGNLEWFTMVTEGTVADRLAWYVYGNQRHSVLTRDVLAAMLREAGFKVYRHADQSTACDDESIRVFDSRFDESFYIEGIRP